MKRSWNLYEALGTCKSFSRRSLGRLGARGRDAAARVPRELGRALLSLAAPLHCLECEAPLAADDRPFCEACAAGIAWIGSSCARCGYPVTDPAPLAVEAPPSEASPSSDPIDRWLQALPLPCSTCARLEPAFDLAAAGGAYSGALRTAVLRFKFRGDRAVAPVLEEALARAAGAPALAAVLALRPALVPVPLHWAKRWWRGRDPVLELAQRLVHAAPEWQGLEVAPHLAKTRWTLAQMRLSRPSRQRNLRGAFRWGTGRRGPRVACPAAVVLIDDVLTTGATASSCAAALKRAGARLVAVLAVARST